MFFPKWDVPNGYAYVSQKLRELSLKELLQSQLIEERERIESRLNNPHDADQQIQSLENQIQQLETEKRSFQDQYNLEQGKWQNYYHVILNKGSGKALDVSSSSTNDGANVHQWDKHEHDNQLWKFTVEETQGSVKWYSIISKRSSKALEVSGRSSKNGANVVQYSFHQEDNQLWKLLDFFAAEGSFYLLNKNSGKVIDVEDKSQQNGANVHQWDKHGKRRFHQGWRREQTNIHANNKIEEAQSNWNNKNNEFEAKKAELERLKETKNTDIGTLSERLQELKNQIENLQEELNELNHNLIEVVRNIQYNPQFMPELYRDRRNLVTAGALLNFARPASSLTAIETCEGNVQLSYFDDEGKMRQTNFDVTADSRNASFEQWVPDKLPVCLQLSNNGYVNCGDKIDLDNSLDNSSFTIEFWAKRDEMSDSNQFVISQGDVEDNKGLHIGFRNNGKFTFAFHGNDLDTKETYNDLNWHYWSCVYDSASNTRTIYRDGEEVTVQDNVPNYQGFGDFILGRLFTSNNFFTGKLAEVRIWNVVLSAEEVAVNHKIRLSGNEPGLLAYYPLNELDVVRDYSGNNKNGSIEGSLQWWGCTAPIGKFKASVMQFDGENDYIDCGQIDLDNSSFTIEFWAKRDVISNDQSQFIVSQGKAQDNKGLHIGFRNNGKFTFAFHGNDLDAETTYSDLEWHYWSCVYDSESKTRTIYRDGEKVATQERVTTDYQGVGNFIFGKRFDSRDYFTGKLTEVRIWNKACTESEIQANMHERLTGTEDGLVSYWQMNAIENVADNQTVQDLVGQHNGTVHEAILTSDNLLPISPIIPNSLNSCEYSTIGIDPEKNRKSAMMRRFFAFSDVNGVNLLPDKRIETLELQWIGNAQFAPTLLGYIEGAPPIPSENLTLEDNYNGATSVELVSSEDVSYSWERSQDVGLGATVSLFAGVKQKIDIQKGIGVSVGETALETKAGFQGDLSSSYSFLNSSNISSSSGLNITNQLSLVGTSEHETKFTHLGKRFVPKNVGYALVVSGLADVYILRLTRSKQMVSYQIEPNQDIPPDVNTITFLINPAYTMNGSLDGMTGSNATSNRFFAHVPEMRSQYGSMYPASYFRLLEAYELKNQIDYRDRQRQAYFEQFNARLVDEASLSRETNNSEYSTGETAVGREDSTKQLDKEINNLNQEINELKNKPELSPEEQQSLNEKRDLLTEKQEQKQAALQERIEELENLQSSSEDTAADQKKKDIQARFESTSQRIHATESFANWQKKMENIQVLAGKRNIVNTYVWDADGGIYSESQQFANTVEHTIGGSFSLNAALGGQGGFAAFGVGFDLKAQATVHLTQTMTKIESRSKGFELNVDISGVENRGVTDHNDLSIIPGEKVDRYRFMSFYLEGSTNNFNDFFDYVVDPEWLASNDEEARALRQVNTGSPNKTWRILHRVTYVERPALK